MSLDEIYARSDAAHAAMLAANERARAARNAYDQADYMRAVAYVDYMNELAAARAVAKAQGVDTAQWGER